MKTKDKDVDAEISARLTDFIKSLEPNGRGEVIYILTSMHAYAVTHLIQMGIDEKIMIEGTRILNERIKESNGKTGSRRIIN